LAQTSGEHFRQHARQDRLAHHFLEAWKVLGGGQCVDVVQVVVDVFHGDLEVRLTQLERVFELRVESREFDCLLDERHATLSTLQNIPSSGNLRLGKRLQQGKGIGTMSNIQAD